MDGIGRFAAIVLMLLALIWIPLEQRKKQQIETMENVAKEYIYEINSLVNRRGEFTKEEFERYSYILFLMQGLNETEMQTVDTEIGRAGEER